ncbi:MAG: magnesium transporter CorA family protein [Oscillospiraceae bacterium]|jgi:magnesium transporter|nr:magnesium transporter CorA family protein [Oscillospiraceae bacterium]
MLRYFKTVNDQIEELQDHQPGCWIDMVSPTLEEINLIKEEYKVPMTFLQAALDEEESAHIDNDDCVTLLVVDTPIVETENQAFVYSTIPLSIILAKDVLITVCSRELTVLSDFIDHRVRGFSTAKRTRFILQILSRVTGKFLAYLKQIDKAKNRVEKALYLSMKNKELLLMLGLEKSLVYFSTSLKANEAVLERMLRQEHIEKYPDDTDLLGDVIIDNKQAIEMCGIYRDILSGTMDAFASVISNNLNIVMKVLTSLTLIISIPTLISSLWGMNVSVPFQDTTHGFYIVLTVSVAISLVCTVILWRKKMF